MKANHNWEAEAENIGYAVVNISSSKNESKSQLKLPALKLKLAVVNISSSKNESKSQQTHWKVLTARSCCKYQ